MIMRLAVALVALGLSLAAFALSAATYNRRPAAAAVAGVCVDLDPYATGTDGGGPYAAVRGVTTPKRQGSVISCPIGEFVSVNP